MKTSVLILLLTLGPSFGLAMDLASLPPNTWIPLQVVTEQPDLPEEKGQWVCAWWNKLVYDPDHGQVLFYDRWCDRKHGGYSI
jgi:hypothetical protein